MTARVDFEVWSTTATLVVTEPSIMDVAMAELRAELTAIGDACSRFRRSPTPGMRLHCPRC